MSESDREFSSITELLNKSAKVDYENFPEAFVRDAYGLARIHLAKDAPIGMSLAALFDLAVTALYLERVPTAGWYYCDREEAPELVYPFVNACPKCTLAGAFEHVKAGKPESANIGKATSTILAAFLDLQAHEVKGNEYQVRTLSDNGLVDACLVGPRVISLFEIKSAPLVAFPLAMSAAPLTELDEDSGELVHKDSHTQATVPVGRSSYLLVNESLRIPVGDPHTFSSKSHYFAILQWLTSPSNFEAFVNSWKETFAGYADANKRSNTYWLTNGCGTPKPRPAEWPKRRSQGYESISDGKSSVGMDRTDDVKKGVYQVLKISTHYKEFDPSKGWEVHAALVSNIHAVKHYEGYLEELEDLVWTLDGPGRSYVLSRDTSQTVIETSRLYNLFDGLISFTRSHVRAPLLKDIYDFDR